jgi:CheY-like chemotaxis protein
MSNGNSIGGNTAKQNAAASKAAETSLTAPVRRILVVDDNVDAADSLALVLRRIGGYEVQVLYDGEHVVALAGEFRPDVILLDIGMPRVNGYTVARQLRDSPATSEAKIVAITGYGRNSDREASQAAGIDLHLLKPVETGDLFAYLQSLRG